jgi:hypothetical protein
MAKKRIQSLVTFVVASKKHIACLAVIACFGAVAGTVTASPAIASSTAQAFMNTIAGNPQPQPVCVVNGVPSKDFHWDAKTKKCVKNATPAAPPPQVCTTEGNVTKCVSNPYVSIGPKKVSASDMASGRVIIGSDVLLKGTQYNSPRCFWTKGGFTNSMLVGGKLKYYHDPVPAKLCPNKNSPTKWVKVAGGTTGRKCDNPATAGKAPAPVLKGIVYNMRSTVNVWLPLNAKASVSIKDTANGCFASASSSAMVRIRLNDFIRTKGNVNISLFASIFAQLKTDAKASTDCKPGPTTTVVTTTTTPGTTTTTPGTTTTTPGTTTTTTTTTPTPAQSCTYNWHFQKGDPYTIYVDVAATSTPTTSFVWGDGTSAGGVYSGIHTYATPPAGPAGSGVTYPLRVSARFNDGTSKPCTSAQGDPFVAAPPPNNGNPGSPTAP